MPGLPPVTHNLTQTRVLDAWPYLVTVQVMPHSWGYALRPITGLTPGLVQLRDGRHRLGALLITGTILLVGIDAALLISPVRLFASPVRLAMLLCSLILLSVMMLVSSATSWPSEHPRSLHRTARLLAPVLALVPTFGGAWVLVPQLQLSRATFITAPVASPSPLPLASSDSPVTTGEETPTSTVEVPTVDGRVNVLLLGGDAGPGRWSLRTDSMNLVSLDPRSGDAAIIGLPRNLVGSPMPPGPLRERYPQGFPGLLNSVYTWGASRSEIVVDALGATDEPGASLVTASVSELTGLRIDAFVLVDMQGFIEVVDAFGGVDIYAPRDLPAPGNVPGGKHTVKDIKKGWQHMDGTDTLSFVRSRKADSDYPRMGRQRCVLASLAAQATPVDIALRWPAISSALAERVRTNLTPELLEALVSAVGKDPSPTRSLALVPPRFSATHWTLEDVRDAVAYTVTGTTPVPELTPAAASSPEIPSTTLQPGPSTSTSAPTEVAQECRIRP